MMKNARRFDLSVGVIRRAVARFSPKKKKKNYSITLGNEHVAIKKNICMQLFAKLRIINLRRWYFTYINNSDGIYVALYNTFLLID